MKNQKFMSIAFAIALLCTLAPNTFALDSGHIRIDATVDGGVAIEAGDDVTLEIDPANEIIVDSTDVQTMVGTSIGNTLTVWNNNAAGFGVTVALLSGDSTPAANTLGIAATTTDLATENGTIKFKSTEDGVLLSGGTDVAAFTAYSGATAVYSIVDVVTEGTILVDHELGGDTDVLPGLYTGTATYTIASL